LDDIEWPSRIRIEPEGVEVRAAQWRLLDDLCDGLGFEAQRPGRMSDHMVLLAVDHLDIGGGLIQQTFLILLAGLVFALALAFGLGGRDWAAAMLARWFPRQEREDR
jgi:hypothetical protein